MISITKSPSFILRRYNFFQRNNLLTRYFDWYKFPNLSYIFCAIYSPDMFKNIESARQSWIMLLAFLLNFSQSSFNVLVREIIGSTVIHYSQATSRSSILSFHSSKLCSLKFSISILKLPTILFIRITTFHLPLKLIITTDPRNHTIDAKAPP